jgi:autotransporter-associated beta strand protein
MKNPVTVDRRSFLRLAGSSAALLAMPTVLTRPATAQAAVSTASTTTTTTTTPLPFVDDYTTNVIANLTGDTNAAVRILTGMAQLWKTGAAWNTGVVVSPRALRASMRHVVQVTTTRTEAQARTAFIYDRQHQSYAMIAGLGPLAGFYKSGAKAVTGITTAPDGTPPTTINDAVPADAPAGSALGPGSVTSDLGQVAQLVNTVRGPYASGNPSKYAYQYPRPWRMTDDSVVVDTGAVDALGYPVYKSNVVVAAQLLRQRSTSPIDDAGFVSGHTNAFYLAGLALAYAVPERFQELLTRAAELSDTRIVAGMHSPVDVIGGRILATALAAATLGDPQNAALKAAARSQAASYFQAQTGTTADTLFGYAHSAGPDTDPYADREVNARAVAPRFTYGLPQGNRRVPMTVPKGAEVLLETRQPYLTAGQRREVLRTTALPSGYDLLDGPEQWGRLNLFAAADAYGAFDADVRVEMNSAQGGFNAADTWRNDIDGTGALVKLGTGALTLTGANRYSGGTRLEAGTLTAGSPSAFGRGGVQALGGTLRLAPPAGHGVLILGPYTQSASAVLEVTLRRGGEPALVAGPSVTLAAGSTLSIRVDTEHLPPLGALIPVILTRTLRGRFSTITVATDGYQATGIYSAAGLFVRISRR